jgi:hypothetical protein
MYFGRCQHTASVLTNGKVLVAAGVDNGGESNSAELYDPSTGTWITIESMNNARYGHTASILTDGTVLVAGGTAFNGYMNSTELY